MCGRNESEQAVEKEGNDEHASSKQNNDTPVLLDNRGTSDSITMHAKEG